MAKSRNLVMQFTRLDVAERFMQQVTQQLVILQAPDGTYLVTYPGNAKALRKQGCTAVKTEGAGS